jgi:hypothetical protein
MGRPEELRASVRIELYRAWSPDPRAVATADRALPYVSATRAGGRFVRLEVPFERTPGSDRVLRDVAALPGVRLAEHARVDMESTLLALVSGLDVPDEGEVMIGGRSMSKLDRDARARFRRDTA